MVLKIIIRYLSPSHYCAVWSNPLLFDVHIQHICTMRNLQWEMKTPAKRHDFTEGVKKCLFEDVFLTYEPDFVLFLAVLENSVLPMG